MANILDYISWRGDLPFSVSPFNEVDALILCQLSYIPFDGIVGDSFKTSVTLCEVANQFFSLPDFEKRRNIGAMINELTVTLLKEAGRSRRFGAIGVCAYKSILDYKTEKQFCALTFLTERKYAFLAFRGTDDTILGWKEDFNMAIFETVPAQKDALKYATQAFSSFRKKFRLGGHSKGGNLALYASANLPKRYKKRIAEIYNNDGPGFRKETLAMPSFKKIVPRLHSFYPQFSIVGMLFSRAGEYTVVESEQSGVMQHDPFSWHVCGSSFVSLEDFDPASESFHVTFNTWFTSIGEKERAKFIETLFKLLQATNARTNLELEKNWLKSSTKILSALTKLDEESRSNMIKTLQLLFKIASVNMPLLSWFPKEKKSKVAKEKSKK